MSGAETQSLFIGYPRRCDGFHFQIFQTLGLAFGLDEPRKGPERTMARKMRPWHALFLFDGSGELSITARRW